MDLKTDHWTSWLFTLGHIGKGTVYSIAGGLALATVLGTARGPSGPQEVLKYINQQPFGNFLLVILAIGLLSYCGWRWYKAIVDPSEEDNGAKGIAKRIAWFCSGGFYGLLAAYALSIVMGSSQSSGGSEKKSAVGTLLSQPLGEILVYVLAGIFLAIAGYQLFRGLKEKYLDKIKKGEISQDKFEIYKKIGKVGHVARAIIFAIISYFLFRAAKASDASQVRGMEGALEFLQNNQYGVWLLGIVGAGMIMYGVFMFVKSQYHFEGID